LALILNIETATTVCSVSLAKDGQLLALKELNSGYTHAENLTLFIEDVMSQANEKLTNIDAVAVSKGPGSYTGLRIGVSSAKGLCYALDKPLIAINTLRHLSLQVSSNQQSTINNQQSLFCPMIDARRMEVYCALFDSDNNEVRATSAEIIDEHFLSDLIEANTIYFFGDGAAKCKPLLSKHSNAVFIDTVVPSAKDMIALSEDYYSKKQFEDLAYFEPFYLKDFVAGKKIEEG
jgi:tRNA threonylcarbamoyladenosine biosynthesis protein TsaB